MSLCVLLSLLHVAFAAVVVQGPLPEERQERKERKLWGLLAAGSMGYDNYRHQADVCHAYQVLREHGIPDQQIVVMMYDDIAYNEENPTKGVIVNRPNGTNVYTGVPKDYTGDSVNPHNFLSVLRGEAPKNGSRKVIASDENDHVFVYFSDHGAPGMLIFPNSNLHARQLIEVLEEMHAKRKFAKMVFFVEACYSGSMFDKLLPTEFNVYVMTAAHPHELSYACYYDESRLTWLGDRFSVNWMEYADQKDLHQHTLHEVYKIVKNETTTSHVMQYGDLEIARLHLSQFMGDNNTTPKVLANISCDPVTSVSAPIKLLEYKIEMETNETVKGALELSMNETLDKREKLGSLFVRIVDMLGANSTVITAKPEQIDFPCYENVTDAFFEKCLHVSKNPFLSIYLYIFINLCTDNYTSEQIVGVFDSACAGLDIKDVI